MTFEEVAANPQSQKVRAAVAYVEESYPVMAERFRYYCGRGAFYDFFCLKQKDYGPENIRNSNDLSNEFGRLMAVREIGRRSGDKVSRISNLTMNAIHSVGYGRVIDALREYKRSGGHHGVKDVDMTTVNIQNEVMDKSIEVVARMQQEKEPANESLRDAMVDMSIYGVIALIVDEGNWGR